MEPLIIGGTGNDLLHNAYGARLYFNVGDGIDRVVFNKEIVRFGGGVNCAMFTAKETNLSLNRNNSTTLLRSNPPDDNWRAICIALGEGITGSNLDFIQFGNDLHIKLKNGEGTYTGDMLVVENYFLSEKYQISQIEFHDGSIWTIDTYASLIQTAPVPNVISGLTAGDDTVYGTTGDDVFGGSSGNDLLVGGEGNDTYIITTDTTNTRISDNSMNTEPDEFLQFDNDCIKFVGVYLSDMSFNRTGENGEHLLISFNGNTVIVDNYFSGRQYQIEKIYFSEGDSLFTYEDMVEYTKSGYMSLHGDDDNNVLRVGNNIYEGVYGGAGNDTIYGGNVASSSDLYLEGEDGNDTINGGSIAEQLYGGLGDDTLNGGSGDDYLSGNEGDDILSGEAGNDVLD